MFNANKNGNVLKLIFTFTYFFEDDNVYLYST